jgi:pimeloyl-ACP methyl ester carboxylesterase
MASPGQPIVIFGGFLSSPWTYRKTAETLTRLSGQPVWIVQARTRDWFKSSKPEVWAYLLEELDVAVKRAARNSPTGRVTLVGHSAGGVMARLYLGPTSFLGPGYRGLDTIDRVVTLGSPHYNLRRGHLRQLVEALYPGAFFAPRVRYTSVAGMAVRGNPRGSVRERLAFRWYERLSGDGAQQGDGLVSVASALLGGSQEVTLEGVSHYTGFGGPWYGEADVVRRWWDAANTAWSSI